VKASVKKGKLRNLNPEAANGNINNFIVFLNKGLNQKFEHPIFLIFFWGHTPKNYLRTKRNLNNQPPLQKTKLKSAIRDSQKKQNRFSKAVKYDIQRIFVLGSKSRGRVDIY